jgi:hypothetical protein
MAAGKFEQRRCQLTINPVVLLRKNGLSVGGVVNWGKAPTSASPGVYVVSLRNLIKVAPLDDSAIQKWIDRVHGMRLDGAPPTVATLRERLEEFWIPTERILYIGLAGTSLATRLRQYYRTPLGDRGPHSGGHWIKTLSVLPETEVTWAEADEPTAAEGRLLEWFGENVDSGIQRRLPGGPVLPFANLQDGAGRRKRHGISGSRLPITSTMALAPGGERMIDTPRPRGTRADVAHINAEIQRLACAAPDRRVAAVEAAEDLDRLGLLRDSPSRPGKPLRNLLRAGLIAHAYQEGGRFWYIECGRAE